MIKRSFRFTKKFKSLLINTDNIYWKCEPANLVSCWITLDDAYLENGAMQVIPGSHKN